MLSSQSSENFIAGKSFPSRDVLKKIKSEGNSQEKLFCKLRSLREKIIKEDEEQAIETVQERKFFGGIHLLNTADEFQMIMFTEGSIRWYSDTCKRDFLYIDATGKLFAEFGTYKSPLYYCLVARSPYSGLPTLPFAEMISTGHTSFAIKHFLEYVIHYRNKVYGKRLEQPKILLLEFSLTLIGGAIKAYNYQTLKDYLDQSYDYLQNSSSSPVLPNTVVYVCSAHILNRVKRFLKQSGAKESFQIVMKLLGKIVTCSSFGDIKKIAHGPLSGLECEVLKVGNVNKVIVQIDSLQQNITASIPSYYFEELNVY